MKCIDYETKWQQFLVENYSQWQLDYATEREAKSSSKSQQANNRRTAKGPGRSKIARLAKQAGLVGDLSDLSEIEGEDEEENERADENTESAHFDERGGEPRTVDEVIDVDEWDEIAGLRKVREGTRSRPNRVSKVEPIMID